MKTVQIQFSNNQDESNGRSLVIRGNGSLTKKN